MSLSSCDCCVIVRDAICVILMSELWGSLGGAKGRALD